MNQKNAIVLGGTFPHITLINKLKQRGFYTILIDYLDSPPGKVVADLHLQESTLDKEKVLQIAKKYEVKLVISTCIDQANVTACYVSEKLNLHVPYSFQTSLDVTDKGIMKKKMMSHDIPTAKYYKVQSVKDLEGVDLRYPLIVKPTDSNSSKGVRRANDREELVTFLSLALESGRKNEAIVEEFITGREIGVDSIIRDGKATLVLSRERMKIENIDKTQQIYGSFWPADINKVTEQKFIIIIEKIAETFNLDNTPLMIQSIINEDQINIIEFAPRIGGGENINIIKMSTEFDMVEAAIDSFLGKDISIDIKKPTTTFFDNYIYCYPAKFKKIVGLDKVVKLGIAEYSNTYKMEGAHIGDEMSSNNRVGVFTVKGSSPSEIYSKIKSGVDLVEVFDHNDKPMMRKKIYENLNIK